MHSTICHKSSEVLAHIPTQVNRSDIFRFVVVVVMKEGTVVETGTHEYLRKNGQEYIRLNQIVEENEAAAEAAAAAAVAAAAKEK